MKYIKYCLMAMLVFMLASCAAPKNPPGTVKQVDLQKYMGKWYEIASFPNFFQRGCVCTQANYQLKNNNVTVLNQCMKSDGGQYQLSQAKGKAWPAKAGDNSKLKVQFFWPFRGDYWILYLTPGYQQVLVGSPNRKYLWILARKKQISSKVYHRLVAIAKHKGFDVDKLVKTRQNCRRVN